MARICEKCKGRLVQGAETCIICGKQVIQAVPPATISKHLPVDAPTPAAEPDHIISFRSPTRALGPQIRFVTAPGGRRIEDTSTTRPYKER